MSNLKIGIVGCSSSEFDQNAAKHLLKFGIETAVADHANVTSVTIVTRLTFLDLLAWEIAQEKGYAVDYRQHFQLSSEGLVFPKDIDVIVRVGSDEWSLQEVKTFRKSGGMVCEYELKSLSTLV